MAELQASLNLLQLRNVSRVVSSIDHGVLFVVPTTVNNWL